MAGSVCRDGFFVLVDHDQAGHHDAAGVQPDVDECRPPMTAIGLIGSLAKAEWLSSGAVVVAKRGCAVDAVLAPSADADD